MPNDFWPMVIGGPHRSGTTLFRRLLNGHPRIFCPAEIKFHRDMLNQYRDDPLAHGRLGESIKALGLPEEEWLDGFGRAYVALLKKAAYIHGKVRWADKSPENAINIHHWHRLLSGEFYFVLIVRHPLDVVASMIEIGMPKTLPQEMVSRGKHVRDYLDAGMSYARCHPDRSIIVRYEELVQDSVRALNNLLTIVGEAYHPQMIDKLGSSEHDSGLEDPKAKGRTRISQENCGRWRRDLAANDVDLLAPILRQISEALNYPWQ